MRTPRDIAATLGVPVREDRHYPYVGALEHDTGHIVVNPEHREMPHYGGSQRVLLHELAHTLGYSPRDYHYNRPEQELFAQGCAAYALGFSGEYDEWYLDHWAQPDPFGIYDDVDWNRLRAMVAIVGEHLRALIEQTEVAA